MKAPKRVAVTGAAGQIGYSLLFRIASGDMLGKDQPVILQLLDITPALPAVKGVVMELDDCAFPLLAGVTVTDDPAVAFKAIQGVRLLCRADVERRELEVSIARRYEDDAPRRALYRRAARARWGA